MEGVPPTTLRHPKAGRGDQFACCTASAFRAPDAGSRAPRRDGTDGFLPTNPVRIDLPRPDGRAPPEIRLAVLATPKHAVATPNRSARLPRPFVRCPSSVVRPRTTRSTRRAGGGSEHACGVGPRTADDDIHKSAIDDRHKSDRSEARSDDFTRLTPTPRKAAHICTRLCAPTCGRRGRVGQAGGATPLSGPVSAAGAKAWPHGVLSAVRPPVRPPRTRRPSSRPP